jgi:protocatechuate 3,4-dioxygenase beta subunit
VVVAPRGSTRRTLVGLALVSLAVLAAIASMILIARCGRESSPPTNDGRATAEMRASGRLRAPRDPRTQPRGSIAGVVQNEAKQPIEKATVCAQLEDEALPRVLTRDPICVLTGTNGAYLLRDLLPTTYSLVAGAPTFRPRGLAPDDDGDVPRFSLVAGEDKRGVDFELISGGVEITGSVEDISGGPIAHAFVRARAASWTPLVETDDRGSFSVWTSPGSNQVIVSADAYVSATRRCSAPCRLTLLMTPESSITGHVIDAASGLPLSGVRISVTGEEWSVEGGSGADRTDAEGGYRISRLLPGRYDVRATTEHGHGRSEGAVLVGLGQTIDGVDIRVFPSARIVGKVMIAGQPARACTESSVFFRSANDQSEIHARTEADGTIVAEGILPGSYDADVRCEGFLAADSYPLVVVGTSDVTDQVWHVEMGATLRGRVLDRRGAPIADADVVASTRTARESTRWAQGRSRPDGSYEVRGLRAASYRVRVWSEKGSGPAKDLTVHVVGTELNLDVILDDVGSIRGKVLDPRGAPVPGVRLSITSMSGDPASAGSDDDGAFGISSLRPGDYYVRADGNVGYNKPLKVTVQAGETASLTLTVTVDSGEIRGTVVDATGKPLADVYVRSALESGDGSGISATRESWNHESPILTGTDGAFTLSRLSPGQYTLRAYRRGGGEAIAEHVAVGTTRRLEIKRTGSIEGTATFAGHLPAERITVAAEDNTKAFARSEMFERTAGRFALRDLPAGHYLLTIDALEGRTSLEIDLAEGETKTGVVVNLGGLVTLTGRVVDVLTHRPVAGVSVQASSINGATLSHVGGGFVDRNNITDEDGRFRIERASRGGLMISGSGPNRDRYEDFIVQRTIEGTGTVDLGDLLLARQRRSDDQPKGSIGIEIAIRGSRTDSNYYLEVTEIDPAGPAAKTAIRLGDVIRTIDGVDVTGENVQHFAALFDAPVGTTMVLGLARGARIGVVVAPRS